MTTSVNRPPLESLSCINADCKHYGRSAQNNLIIRKIYGKDQIRYLRCRCCGEEFSERKLSGLWNCKIPEGRAIRVGQQLAEGTSLKGTTRLTMTHPDTVRRLAVKFGHHADRFHDQQAQDLDSSTLEMDDQHGHAETKAQQQWDAVAIDSTSKFLVQVEVGLRDASLIERLMRGSAQGLKDPQDLVLMTDGEASYRTLFPEIFGVPYSPPRQGSTGRLPKLKYRIPRTPAHVQFVKHRQGKQLEAVTVAKAHGSWRRIQQALDELGYQVTTWQVSRKNRVCGRAPCAHTPYFFVINLRSLPSRNQVPNTSTVERFNATARRMNAHQVQRSLAFAHRSQPRKALAAWSMAVYNWVRPHRSLRQKLAVAEGKRRYQQRTPVMALGLTQRIWSEADVLRTPVYS